MTNQAIKNRILEEIDAFDGMTAYGLARIMGIDIEIIEPILSALYVDGTLEEIEGEYCLA